MSLLKKLKAPVVPEKLLEEDKQMMIDLNGLVEVKKEGNQNRSDFMPPKQSK